MPSSDTIKAYAKSPVAPTYTQGLRRLTFMLLPTGDPPIRTVAYPSAPSITLCSTTNRVYSYYSTYESGAKAITPNRS